MKMRFLTSLIIASASGASAIAEPVVGFAGFEVLQIQDALPTTGMEHCVMAGIAYEAMLSSDIFDIFVMPVSIKTAILLRLDETMVMEPPEITSIGILNCNAEETQWLRTDEEQVLLGKAMFETNGTQTMQAWINDIDESHFLSTETLPINLAEDCVCKLLESETWQDYLATEIAIRSEQQSGGN